MLLLALVSVLKEKYEFNFAIEPLQVLLSLYIKSNVFRN